MIPPLLRWLIDRSERLRATCYICKGSCVRDEGYCDSCSDEHIHRQL